MKLIESKSKAVFQLVPKSNRYFEIVKYSFAETECMREFEDFKNIKIISLKELEKLFDNSKFDLKLLATWL